MYIIASKASFLVGLLARIFAIYYNCEQSELFSGLMNGPDVRYIIESVDSISRDERDVPLTQYITNA